MHDFRDWVEANPNLMDEYADLLMYTLPLPRYKWYEPSNFEIIESDITHQTNQLTQDLGFYPLRSNMDLLSTM